MEKNKIDEIMDLVFREIKEFKDINNRVPTSREWDGMGFKPSRATLRKNMCMSLNQIYSYLGFNEGLVIRKDFTKREVIDAFVRFYEEYNRSPCTEDLTASRISYMPSLTMLYKYFSGIDEALKEAGLPKLQKGYSDEHLLSKLDEFIKEYNRLPNKSDCTGINRNTNLPEYKSYSRFGGIKGAVLKLNYPKTEINRLLNIVELDDYKENIKLRIDEHILIYGKPPGSKEWDEFQYKPSRKALEKELNMPFNEILISLGFTPDNKSPIHYSDNKLLELLRLQAQIKGSTPTFEELKQMEGIPHPKAYIEHFGSYDNAIKLSGLESNRIYSKEFLISEIKRFIETYDFIPSANVFRATKGYPSTKAYKRIWGSFTDCIISLGLEPVCFQIKNAFSKRVLSKDNHICFSQEEFMVDNYLHERQIAHDKEIYYPLSKKYNCNKKKRCDFLIRTSNGVLVYIEYAGLINKEAYFQKLKEKIELCKELSINLIVIYPWQLRQLDKIILETLVYIEVTGKHTIVS